jgi:hypothetical protein
LGGIRFQRPPKEQRAGFNARRQSIELYVANASVGDIEQRELSPIFGHHVRHIGQAQTDRGPQTTRPKTNLQLAGAKADDDDRLKDSALVNVIDQPLEVRAIKLDARVGRILIEVLSGRRNGTPFAVITLHQDFPAERRVDVVEPDIGWKTRCNPIATSPAALQRPASRGSSSSSRCSQPFTSA